ncbi:trypsin-like peptidase domain-containing protein [Streptomyces sp. NPDC002926]
MPHFIDSLPFDWSEPAARELRDCLADTYFREEPVIALAQQAGIGPGSVAWDRPMSLVWHDLLEKARNQDKLRLLLSQVTESADAAVAVRIRELLQTSPVVEAPAPPAPAGVWKDFAEPDQAERQIFTVPSLLDIAFLRRAVDLAPAVARLLVSMASGSYYGTAFRIADDLLLTNHHVLFDHTVGDPPASEAQAWFGYETDFSGRHVAHEVVQCQPETVIGDKADDWAVIRVASPMPPGTPMIPLTDPGQVAIGDRVYIIQHPRGGAKKIGMHHNIVRHADDNVVQYWTDTEAGSSGSPVFDEQWRLVALHHRWVETGTGASVEYRNQGIRIQRVVNGLRAAGVL